MTDKYRFIAISLDYIHKMTGKGAENVLEMRAYIKGSSLLSIMAVNTHREVCDIYGEGQMSHRTG